MYIHSLRIIISLVKLFENIWRSLIRFDLWTIHKWNRLIFNKQRELYIICIYHTKVCVFNNSNKAQNKVLYRKTQQSANTSYSANVHRKGANSNTSAIPPYQHMQSQLFCIRPNAHFLLRIENKILQNPARLRDNDRWQSYKPSFAGILSIVCSSLNTR